MLNFDFFDFPGQIVTYSKMEFDFFDFSDKMFLT